MANSCCWISGNSHRDDSACFSGFNPSARTKNQYIVVYLEKSPFNRKEMRRWFFHLKKMGFDFKYHFDKEREAYLVNTSKITPKGRKYLTAFCMLVRFLWEGYYRVEHGSYCDDRFIQVLPIYYALYNYKKKHNKNELICMACSVWSMFNKNFNSNHFLCYGGGSYIRKDFTKLGLGGSVNGYFSNNHSINFTHQVGRINNNNVTHEQIIKIYKFYESQRKKYCI